MILSNDVLHQIAVAKYLDQPAERAPRKARRGADDGAVGGNFARPTRFALTLARRPKRAPAG